MWRPGPGIPGGGFGGGGRPGGHGVEQGESFDAGAWMWGLGGNFNISFSFKYIKIQNTHKNVLIIFNVGMKSF